MSTNANRVYKGVVRKGAVVLGKDFDLPDGMRVEVRPDLARGTPAEIVAALNAPPHLEQAAVDELMRRIEEGRRPVRFDSALD